MSQNGTLMTNGDTAVTIQTVIGKWYTIAVGLLTGAETLTFKRVISTDKTTIKAFTASEDIRWKATSDEVEVSISNGGAGTFRYLFTQDPE